MIKRAKNVVLPRISLSSLLSLFLLVSFSSTVNPAKAQAGGGSPVAKGQLRQTACAAPDNAAAAELDVVSDSAEEIFELASAGKIERIPKRLEALKKSASSLSYPQSQSSDSLSPRLGQTMALLEQACSAKERLDIMRYANRITLIAATLTVPLKPCVPTELSILEYNSRELAIWSETKKTEKLPNIVMRMHLAWQALMPKLIEHNGTKELRRFSDTMGRLETARTPEDYNRLSKQAPAEIGTMKVIFAKPAK